VGLLEHVGAHHQVRVPVPPGVRAIGSDPADLGGEVEDNVGFDLVEQSCCLREIREVELGAARNHDLVPLGAEARREPRAEEAGAAG